MSPSSLEETETMEVEEVEEEVEYEEVSEDEDEESEPQAKEQPEPQNPNPNNKSKPSIPESIAHLQSLHTVLASFLHHYSSYHQTLDSINSSISQSTPPKIEPIDLKLICQLSAAKPLRKYISAHLSDPNRLRQEVPEALKLSPDPANFILESVGKFYLRGKKSYERSDSQAIEVRRVSILLLEFYMIAGCPVVESSVGSKKVVESAKKMAVAWKSRLVSEGGVEVASAVDALGLMLLVGGFGVPQEFRMRDLNCLLKLSNLKKKGDVLRRSRILVEKMPAPSQRTTRTPKSKPSIPESIAHLQSLHTVLASFLHHYSSYHQTLDSINSSISQSTPPKIEPIDLKLICQLSAAKPLRKYISAHLSDPDRLRQEVPEALKLSPDPANFILESVGKFYLRGKKSYERSDSQAIEVRRVSILLLEFYMIAGCPVVESSVGSKKVVESAKKMAMAWRSRLVSEGGVEVASAVDALGLMLLVGGFGVPQEFRMRDLNCLVKLSNLKKKGDVLRRSRILVEKMPDIVKDLIAKEMHVEAMDIIYAFRLEEKFSPVVLLSSFVEKTCEAGSEERREGQYSTRSLKEATEKQLAALKSVLKCLEDHNIDASELSSLRITQKIAKCEKEIIKFERKLQEKNVKRKVEDAGPVKNQYNQAKQLRPFSAEASHGSFPQSIRPTQGQGVTGITDSRYAYNGGYIASIMPVSTEASHGLADKNNIGLLARNVHDSIGGSHANAAYQNSSGQSLLRALYASGHEYSRPSAAAGQNYYQPSVAGQNYYQPTVAGQNYYQTPSSSVVTGARNLYQFVDMVAERELPNYITTASTVLPTAATTLTNPSHQLPYTG